MYNTNYFYVKCVLKTQIEQRETEANVADWTIADTIPKTREELAAEKLREAIMVGHFKAGEKLDQGAISKQLNVSLSPVREAIRTLAAEGLITMVPHKGAHVAELSVAQLEELHEVRGLLEGQAAQNAVPHLTQEQLEHLASIIASAHKTNDNETLQALNYEFHQTLYGAFPQPETLKIIKHIRNKVAPYIRLYLDAGLKEEAWSAHERIYEACKARDADLAAKETRRHLDEVCLGILKALKAEVNE